VTPHPMSVRAGLVAAVVAGGLALAGCGSSAKMAQPSPSSSSPRSAIEHACSDATLSVPKGRQLDFTSCGPQAGATVTDPGLVLNQLGPLVFIARAAGQATIDITQAPTCSPGQVCSQVRVMIARIVVQVS